jgi:hypothetical protein
MRTHDPCQSLCRIFFSFWILGFNNSIGVQDEDVSDMEIDPPRLVVRARKQAQYGTPFV